MRDLPVHEAIRRDIERDIRSGRLRPGDRIASEAELSMVYGCARMTVNKALSMLAATGLVERRKRAGTLVARPRVEAMVLAIPDLPAEVVARGQRYRYDLRHRAVRLSRTFDPDEQALAANGRILAIDGVHFADDQPLALEHRLVSLDAVPDIEAERFGEEPPGTWLLHHVPWTDAETRIDAQALDPTDAELLEVEPGSACLTLERRTWRGDTGITIVRQQFVAGAHTLVARFSPGQFP